MSETSKVNSGPSPLHPSGTLFSDIVISGTETVDKGTSGAYVIYCIQVTFILKCAQTFQHVLLI